ncbi:TetR/AcrR family transcriptional regulator [Mycolicibacterium hippocampi]|uniref:Transcriptional regulator, AcrR family n=1 Tax=Mycolicibacterium hippocampi TaxID=659824 RepID=A0A850PGE4_9MYCO|nr:Transcriptional regulator, AcrR family [Mycolicibacterium hippocampi]
MRQLSRPYKGVAPSDRVEQRRAQLLDAAVDVFGTIGYRTATIDQICAKAGLSKRYFYESFADSEALLLACYQRCADEIHAAMVSAFLDASGDSIDSQVYAALAAYFGAIDDDQRRARITLLEILGVSPAVDSAYSTQTARFADSIHALAPAAFGTSTLPETQLHLLAQGIIGAVTTTATIWLLDHRRRPRSELINATHVLVTAVLDRLPST